MRFACPACHATFQPAAAAPVQVDCAACGAAMQAEADVLDLHRIPTRRYDLQDLKARLLAEREAIEAAPEPGQAWFVGVAGRRVGPLTRAGLEGLKARGQLAGNSLVWRDGWPVWAAAEAVPELRPLLGLAQGVAVLRPRELVAPPLPAQESLPFAALEDEVTSPAPAATSLEAAATLPGRAAPGEAPAGTAAPPRPRLRARRADAQFSAPSDAASAPAALRVAFLIALAAIAVLFTGRACAKAPAHPQVTGGSP